MFSFCSILVNHICVDSIKVQNKMSAPIAQTEDDWESFTDFKSSEKDVCFDSNGNNKVDQFDDSIEFSEPSMVSYKSVEDLVHTFEEKLANCFRLDDATTNEVSKNIDYGMPKPFNLNELKNNLVWKQLTDNYGLVQPLDWKNSIVHRLHLPALNIKNTAVEEDSENIDENELKNQLDFHHMVEYNVYTESLQYSPYTTNGIQTADEVIEEIEQMMIEANDADAAIDIETQETTGIIFDQVDSGEGSLDSILDSSLDNISNEENLSVNLKSNLCLSSMSLAELNKHFNHLNDNFLVLSNQLLKGLGTRDELKYEIETKKLFISTVLDVQSAQEKFHKVNNYKRNGLKRSTTMNSIPKAGHHLTAKVPYNNNSQPTMDDLQVLIKILEAIRNDSDEVPTLITNYILKVICPTTGDSQLKL